MGDSKKRTFLDFILCLKPRKNKKRVPPIVNQNDPKEDITPGNQDH